MKNNPDNRSDNADKIQRNLNCTIKNMELADDMIARTDDFNTKKDLKEKNKRRDAALDSMRNEIKDEAEYQSRQ